jgi:AcrR family transcriptional regulator
MSRAVLSVLYIALGMGHHGPMPAAPARRTVRDRVRAEMTDEIKAVARRQLAEQGAAALSLRAVAREVGLVSSAVYRYFPSRDDLITALIIDAYDAVGAAAEATEPTGRARPGPAERWQALARAVRSWAQENRHEYALVYGSPIPGYAAPRDTVDPATRVDFVFLRLLADGVASGEIEPGPNGRLPRTVRADLSRLRDTAGLDLPDPVLLRGLSVWAELFGSISLELFGHFQNVIDDGDGWFEAQMTRAGRRLLTPPEAGR